MFEMKKKLSWIADADADADADSQVNMMGAQVVQGCGSGIAKFNCRCQESVKITFFHFFKDLECSSEPSN